MATKRSIDTPTKKAIDTPAILNNGIIEAAASAAAAVNNEYVGGNSQPHNLNTNIKQINPPEHNNIEEDIMDDDHKIMGDSASSCNSSRETSPDPELADPAELGSGETSETSSSLVPSSSTSSTSPGSPTENSSCSPVTVTTTTGSGPNKRKEVLSMPMPPGSLPPRKRAKTKDEKEQRRIERIMRNRQAAHASREKKRRHLEDLEKKCVTLSSENDALRKQAHDTKEGQMQMLEQQYLLMTRFQQLESLVKTAKATGDLTVLDSVDEIAMAVPKGMSLNRHHDNQTVSGTATSQLGPADADAHSHTATGPFRDSVAIKEEYASPDSLILSCNSPDDLLNDIVLAEKKNTHDDNRKEVVKSSSTTTTTTTTTTANMAAATTTTKTTAQSGSTSSSSSSASSTCPTSPLSTDSIDVYIKTEDEYNYSIPNSPGWEAAGSPTYSLKTESDSEPDFPNNSTTNSLFTDRAHHPAASTVDFGLDITKDMFGGCSGSNNSDVKVVIDDEIAIMNDDFNLFGTATASFEMYDHDQHVSNLYAGFAM